MKFLVYILIFQFTLGAFIPRNDFSQLTKIPDLIAHYQLHVEEAKLQSQSFDVFDFVYVHYISPDEHVHKVPYDHSDLPFKSLTASMVICCSQADISESTQTLPETIFNSCLQKLSNREYNLSFFHPPS